MSLDPGEDLNSQVYMKFANVKNKSNFQEIIEEWVKSIEKIHESKPSPSNPNTKPLPKVEELLQTWPQELKNTLETTGIPPPDMDCDLETYVELICNLFDIPVYESRIQSLHVFAQLYLARKNIGCRNPLKMREDMEYKKNKSEGNIESQASDGIKKTMGDEDENSDAKSSC